MITNVSLATVWVTDQDEAKVSTPWVRRMRVPARSGRA
jgi:hypothetical protein